MLVVFRTLEVLALLTVVGLPVSRTLLSALDKSINTPARYLLAPLTGLACLALTGALLYALGTPIYSIVVPFWVGVGVMWLAFLVVQWRRFRPSFPRPHVPAATWTEWLGLGAVVAGGALVLLAYLWPFIQDGQLVFWHYAGSDGYMYMRIAEYVGQFGARQEPDVRAFDASLGWVLEEMQHFHYKLFVDKPATMGTLAETAALLGLLPQETYSPLTIAVQLLGFLSLVVFGRSLHLGWSASALFATFGALGPVAWLLSTNTYLGNLLALPFFALLLPITRPLSARVAAYAGLMLGAETLLFPDSTLVVLGLLTPWVAVHAWRAIRTRTFARFGAQFAVALTIWILPLLLFWDVLPATVVGRLIQVVGVGPDIFGAGGVETGLAFHPLQSASWIWPAFNLNRIPPEPLKADQAPFVVALVCAIAAYVGCCVWTRRFDFLVSGVLSLALLLLAGIFGGIFRGEYELFRALAIVSFIPLAVLFELPHRVADLFRTRWARISATVLVALAVTPVLWRFALNDVYQFNLAYGAHLADAQYTLDDIHARRDLTSLLGTRPLVLSTETPSFTAFANVVMLFSPLKLGIPNSWYKFVFFRGMNDPGMPLVPKNQPYTSEFVLRNRHYADIFEPWQTRSSIYKSDDFAVFDNDLIPFFDNDTFPMQNAFPIPFLVERKLLVARTLGQPTDVAFFSKTERDVSLEMQFTAPAAPPGQTPIKLPVSLSIQLDDSPAQSVPIDKDGLLHVSALRCRTGLHMLKLVPHDQAALVTQFRILQSPS